PATPQLCARGDAITMAISLTVNGTTRSVEAEPDTPMLYVLRNDFELNGPKFGCCRAQCGACTVLINGAAVRSCVMPIAHLSPNEITAGGARYPRQAASIAEGLHRRAGRAVRLLRQRHDHCGGRPAQAQSAADRSRGSQRARRQSVSLRQPQPHHPRRHAGGAGEREDLTMNGS